MSEDLPEDEVARHWDANAADWAREVRRGNDLARELMNNPAFLELIGDLRARDVLDAGCGEGYNTRILAARGARMTGVDISDGMLALAREEERRAPLGIRYERASYTNLGIFADGSFDAAVSFMAFMDGPGFDRAMAEIFRVLRRGAMLAFSITHPCFVTKGTRWLRDEAGAPTQLVVGDYFNSDDWVDRWRFTDAPPDAPRFSVPRFDRTLSHYVNTLIGAGFVVQRLDEPRPPEAYCRDHPSQLGWRRHAALYLHVRALKP